LYSIGSMRFIIRFIYKGTTMKVFISWSGRKSHEVAIVIKEWIVQVIQAVDPWISSEIGKGTKFAPEISDQLEDIKVGIICLTENNQFEPWMNFEAGALSKTKDAKVCTLLLGIRHTDVKPPLSQFQHTVFEKKDVYKLLLSINDSVKASNERDLSENTLRDIFEVFWPKLEVKIREIMASGAETDTTSRSDRDILEEILEILRKRDQLNSIASTWAINMPHHQGTGKTFTLPLDSLSNIWITSKNNNSDDDDDKKQK